MNIFVVGLGLSRTEDRNIYVTYIYVYITDVNCTFFSFSTYLQARSGLKMSRNSATMAILCLFILSFLGRKPC
jgi:hypothetical protein